MENLTLLIAIVVAVLLVGFAIGLLVTWLGSRGRFMLLDGIVRNRGAVVEPWREYRREGNSHFKFVFCFGLIGFLVFVLILAAGGLIAWPDIREQQFGQAAIVAIVWGVVAILGFSIAMGVINLFLKDFVAPIMYLRRVTVMEAWRIFGREMLAGRKGTICIYVLFRIVIAFATGILATFVICCTCCLAAIPYVSSVVLLPLTVFIYSYSLYFLQQFGPKWQVFAESDTPPVRVDPV
jgi:hypothetical protein